MMTQANHAALSLAELRTPALMLNANRMQANIGRMQAHLAAAQVVPRPHVKTAKSLPVIEQMVADQATPRLTVSTLREAAEVLSAGYTDVLYAVGVVPQKLPELQQLASQYDAQVSVIVDSVVMAEALLESVRGRAEDGLSLNAFIELDVDDHRAGVAPDSDELLAIGRVLTADTAGGAGAGLLRGVMTHAGGAYDCRSRSELESMAERERGGAVAAAQVLRHAGMPVAEVSIGSTPTALVATSFTGVTEVRVGVYVFNDLVMAGLGVCQYDDIALSVLTTVIGHQQRRNTLLIDAGWMALSSDRSTARFARDQGLGSVVTAEQDGTEDLDLVVASANQEHGLVVPRSGAPLRFEHYPIGSQLRVLPVHACATAAQFAGYQVECSDTGPCYWPRFRGW